MSKLFKIIVVCIVSLLVLVPGSFAASVNLDSDGVAIEGHDPVAYFTQNAAVKGSEEFTAKHDGAIYKFSSQKHKDAFEAAPAKYAPQYGGFCAYAVSYGSTASVEPDQFSVVDGKLYLNFNAGVQSKWSKDKASYITKADKNWPGLK